MKKFLTIIGMVVLTFIVVSCDKEYQNDVDKVNLNDGVEKQEISIGNSKFAFDIFRELNEETYDENIFISPFSISSALAMTLNGADGDTLTQMMDALRLSGMSIDDINNGYAYLNNLLINEEEYSEDDRNVDANVSIANSLWLNDMYVLNEEFREAIRSNFDGDATKLNFSNHRAVDTINDWVSGKTNELIDQIINELNYLDVLVLINTIYFNGSWSTPFNPTQTETKDFYALDGSTVDVEMMQRRDHRMKFYEDEEMEAVKLPYGAGKYSMYVFLPNETEDINAFIENMDADKWNLIRDSFMMYDVTLELPKFKIEYGIKVLNDVLKNMGMEKAFDENNAEFSNMVEGFDKDDILYISKVNHKAVVEVMEKGTEAAAATAVVVSTESGFLTEEREFTVNRPFMFIIADRNGNILFVGKKAS
ncbi:serpin family protein [Mycoplasmatota bacterium zrk1]